jgi:hypothetical protein
MFRVHTSARLQKLLAEVCTHLLFLGGSFVK